MLKTITLIINNMQIKNVNKKVNNQGRKACKLKNGKMSKYLIINTV